jgi:hypothetical protein
MGPQAHTGLLWSVGYLTQATWLRPHYPTSNQSHVTPPPSFLLPSPKLTKICNQLFRCHVGFSAAHERLCFLTCTKTIMQYLKEAMLHVVRFMQKFLFFFREVTDNRLGACGSMVVNALFYKPKGRGFDTRWGECFFFFSIYLILSAALGPAVHSASDRNKYQKLKNNVSGE